MFKQLLFASCAVVIIGGCSCPNPNVGDGGGGGTGGTGGGDMVGGGAGGGDDGGGTGGGAMGGGTGGGTPDAGALTGQLWMRGALDGGSVVAIYRQAPPGTAATQVSTFPRRTNGISVSDDGTTLVTDYDATLDELVVGPTDGGAEISLHTSISGTSILGPLLSPDKAQVAYTEGNTNTLGFDLMVIPTTGTGTARRASPMRSSTVSNLNVLNVSAFSFSPDSRYLAALGDFSVDGTFELHVFDLTTGTSTALINATNVTTGNNSRDFGWTDTGQILVRAALLGSGTRLYTCTVTGTCALLSGTTNSFTVGSLAVSKDGTFAIYASNERGTGAYDLYRVPTAGGTPTRIAPDAPAAWKPAADSVLISPNGQWVTAQANAGTGVGLYVFSTTGGTPLVPLYTASGTIVIFSLTFSPNSGYLAFRGDLTLDGSYDVYRLADLITPALPPILLQSTQGGSVTELRWTN